MSAQSNDKTKPGKQGAGPESRGERWAKYGSNVALTIVVAIVLAILITYIAQANDWKVDTTRGGENSLRPQTKNVLHDLNTDITLVSLYSKANSIGPQEPGAPKPLNKPAMVADLLDSYKGASSHISVQVIDPTDAAKLNALETQLDDRYGKGISDYKDFLGQYDAAAKKLLGSIAAEVDKVNSIVVNDKKDEVAPQILGSLKELQTSLEDSRANVRKGLNQHRPDYRAITSSLKAALSKTSETVKAVNDFFQKYKADPQVSEAVRNYIAKNQPALQLIQKQAEQQQAKIDKLPTLKVDELQSALNVPNPILVLGPTSWRVLSETQVWPENKTARAATDVKLQPSFAGEQQITAAIIGLTSAKKPKVVLLRPGGGPLTSPGFPPFQAGGPFSDLAERLKMYNFDVLEKDMSGTYAMQAMQQGQMAQPEPSWQDMQDAVWIILDIGGPIQGSENVGLHLAEHLGHGGSAVLLTQPAQGGMMGGGTDPFQDIVKTWGIDLHPDTMAVHDQPPPAPSTNIDPLQDAFRRPFIWDLREYGDAALARPVNNLESLMLMMSPVTTHDVAGYTVQKLIPLPGLPAAPRSWGAKDFQDLLNNGAAPKFDSAKDMPAPIYGGAVSEKKGGGRLVVIGNIQFAINQLMEMPDETIARDQDELVARFPGNIELATNSVFWCAKMDQMLALSPAALQVSRINNMSPVTLNFWRIGLLLILLPGAVLVSGLGMYFSRRD